MNSGSRTGSIEIELDETTKERIAKFGDLLTTSKKLDLVQAHVLHLHEMGMTGVVIAEILGKIPGFGEVKRGSLYSWARRRGINW